MSSGFDARMAEWKEQIDDCLANVIAETKYPDEFKRVLEYALFPEGKRLRPILLLEWHSLYSPPDEYALRFACGIEILHAYSLIHDDMPCMDNDEYRRGKLTVHRQFGEGVALLAGDALMDLAYRILNAPTPRGNVSPFAQFVCACGDEGIIHGQYIDLFGTIASVDELLKMYRRKTGALISLSCMCGFALGKNLDYGEWNALEKEAVGKDTPHKNYYDADEWMCAAMLVRAFGEEFGTAFQLYDDISEYINGESISATSVLKYVDLEKAKRLLNQNLNKAAGELVIFNRNTEYLKELLDKFVIV